LEILKSFRIWPNGTLSKTPIENEGMFEQRKNCQRLEIALHNEVTLKCLAKVVD
jgi:hypothetical protein